MSGKYLSKHAVTALSKVDNIHSGLALRLHPTVLHGF